MTACIYTWLNLNLKPVFFLDRINFYGNSPFFSYYVHRLDFFMYFCINNLACTTMIFITVIAVEEVIFERGDWDADAGKWLSDPDTWYKHVHRHIFAYSPDNDKLIRPDMYIIKDKFYNDRRIFASKLLDESDTFYSIKMKEYEESSSDLRNPNLRYYNDVCQYIDIDSTRHLCETLNKSLDYLLYIPCFHVDPSSVTPVQITHLKGGDNLEEIFPLYLPNPICRISKLKKCLMHEVFPKDFKFVKYERIEKKRSKYDYIKRVSWSQIRKNIVDKYISGEIVPYDEIEEKELEEFCEEQELEELKWELEDDNF